MRHRPDVERHHQDWRTILRRHGGHEPFGGGAQHREGALARLAQFRVRLRRNAGLEHRRIIGRLVLGELQIGLADAVECREHVGTAAVPGRRKHGLELIKAAPRHVGQQLVAVAKMPVGRRRADPRPARRFREGKAGRTLLRDQFQRGADQGLLEIAVVIAAGTRTSALPGPAHVKGLYMTRAGASNPSLLARRWAALRSRSGPDRRAWRSAALWGSAAPGRRRRRPPAHAPRPGVRHL